MTTAPTPTAAAQPRPAALTPEKISEWASGERAEQIAAGIAREISAGTLRPRQELPSSTTLAARWGASRTTVSRAKELLAAHGILKHRNRRYHVA